jgi:hypothetical protein
MDSVTLRVDSGSGYKDIVVIGEIHIYGKKESEWAIELLDKGGFDYAFFEGVKLNGFFRILFIGFFRFAQFITGRNKKTLRELIIERGVPFKYLEEDELPAVARAGLSLLIILLFLGIVYFMILLLRHEWLSASVLVITVLLALLASKFLDYSWGAEYLPVNKKERDRVMSSNLIRYIEEVDFEKGLVVVGKAHLPQMVVAIQNNFESYTFRGEH